MELEIKRIDQKIRSASQYCRMLEGYRHEPAARLEDVYEGVLRDMIDTARALNLGVSFDGDKSLFTASAVSGLREARIKLVFSKIPRQGVLVSLLESLEESARQRPFLIAKLLQEKDGLTAEILLLGL